MSKIFPNLARERLLEPPFKALGGTQMSVCIWELAERLGDDFRSVSHFGRHATLVMHAANIEDILDLQKSLVLVTA